MCTWSQCLFITSQPPLDPVSGTGAQRAGLDPGSGAVRCAPWLGNTRGGPPAVAPASPEQKAAELPPATRARDAGEGAARGQESGPCGLLQADAGGTTGPATNPVTPGAPKA